MRILIYSHDSFGLGHLRRCRLIAHALVKRFSDVSVLILSGSPIIGSFDFRARVDFIRIPGVIKLRDGEYTSLSLHIDIAETLALRASIIEHTAKIFMPDLFLVDKEPLGLRGEVETALRWLKSRGVPLVLGVRDVLDDPELLHQEWQRKNVIPALETLYDEIWVYGCEQITNPFAGIDLPKSVEHKIIYTGYLSRKVPKIGSEQMKQHAITPPFYLVTPGGGGDGEALVEWVLKAYTKDTTIPLPAVIVLGPFMNAENRDHFMEWSSRLDNVTMLTFDSHMEHLMKEATAIIAMGGYNTFCEILSFDKPALLVPRTVPRKEQYIRAERAQSLGWVRMLEEEEGLPEEPMIAALHALKTQPKPSQGLFHQALDGLPQIAARVNYWRKPEMKQVLL